MLGSFDEITDKLAAGKSPNKRSKSDLYLGYSLNLNSSIAASSAALLMKLERSMMRLIRLLNLQQLMNLS